MKRSALTVLLVLLSVLPTAVQSQTLAEYKVLRAKYKIHRGVGVEALETLIGTRIFEVKGMVKGVVGGTPNAIILVESTGGGNLMVQCKKAPEWLFGNDTPARLLVQATREDETSSLKATLIGVSDESAIATIEQAEELKALQAIRKTNPYKVPTKSKVLNWNLEPTTAMPYYAAFIKKQNKRLTDQQAIKIATGVIGFSNKYGVDARLVMAMVLVESRFNPNATSGPGAMGLGQLMPGTASGMGIGNPFDINENLYGTVRIIRGHLERYHKKTGDPYESLVLALAAYNAGSGSVRKYDGVPPYRETKNYIQKVIGTFRALCGL